MMFSNFYKIVSKLKTTVVFVRVFLLIYLVTILLVSGYIIELIKELRFFSYNFLKICKSQDFVIFNSWFK